MKREEKFLYEKRNDEESAEPPGITTLTSNRDGYCHYPVPPPVFGGAPLPQR